MTTPLIRIKTEGFRAIGNADIIINGITVVAGENGCGKSTLSKLLYYLYKTASNYDLLVSKELRFKLKDVERFLDILQHELYSFPKDKNTREELRKELRDLYRNLEAPKEEQLQIWIALIRKMQELYFLNPSGKKEEDLLFRRNSRLRYILSDILKLEKIDEKDDSPLPFDKIEDLVKNKFKEAFGKMKSRPNSLFKEALRNVFSEGELPKVFDVMEYEEQIISLTKDSLSIPYLIQNAIYIDTPMMIGVDDSDNEHWNDLNEQLMRSGKSSFSDLPRTIIKDIIHGDISIDDEQIYSFSNFSYKRDDGSIYNLLDCATGVKSFAILQLLIKNGTLTNKTLLIIDEPESNLHPQWIIEYARLIVLLNKIVGVKSFISSHNPDMVSAIKYISEKEGISENLNFYLAEKRKEKYLYDYKHLGIEIDPIFASFNIAIERINQYGGS